MHVETYSTLATAPPAAAAASRVPPGPEYCEYVNNSCGGCSSVLQLPLRTTMPADVAAAAATPRLRLLMPPLLLPPLLLVTMPAGSAATAAAPRLRLLMLLLRLPQRCCCCRAAQPRVTGSTHPTIQHSPGFRNIKQPLIQNPWMDFSVLKFI